MRMLVGRLAPLVCLLCLIIATATTAQSQVGTNYGFEVNVTKEAASGEFVVDVIVMDLATGQLVAKPQLLGPANTDLTFVGTNRDYEYQVVTRPTSTSVVSTIEVRHAGTTIRQRLTVAVPH